MTMDSYLPSAERSLSSGIEPANVPDTITLRVYDTGGAMGDGPITATKGSQFSVTDGKLNFTFTAFSTFPNMFPGESYYVVLSAAGYAYSGHCSATITLEGAAISFGDGSFSFSPGKGFSGRADFSPEVDVDDIEDFYFTIDQSLGGSITDVTEPLLVNNYKSKDISSISFYIPSAVADSLPIDDSASYTVYATVVIDGNSYSSGGYTLFILP